MRSECTSAPGQSPLGQQTPTRTGVIVRLLSASCRPSLSRGSRAGPLPAHPCCASSPTLGSLMQGVGWPGWGGWCWKAGEGVLRPAAFFGSSRRPDTRRVGGLLGVAGSLSGTVSPFRAEQGTSLETPWRARSRSPDSPETGPLVRHTSQKEGLRRSPAREQEARTPTPPCLTPKLQL